MQSETETIQTTNQTPPAEATPPAHVPMTKEEFEKRAEKLRQSVVEPTNPLTPMHWAFYRVVRENTLAGKPPLTQRQAVDLFNAELAKRANDDGERLVYVEDDANHCRKLWDLVQDLINSPEVEKIVVQQKYTYFLGNEYETQWYRTKLYWDGIKKLVRAARVAAKAKANGQGKFINCHGRLITDEDIHFVESFPQVKKEESPNDQA